MCLAILEYIEKGTTLYRYVDVEPNNVKLGMTHNKGRNGRCNLHQDIYYCCADMSAISIECGSPIKGSVILSSVIERLVVGMITDENWLQVLRGRVEDNGEYSELVHDIVFKPLNKDIVTTYEMTNALTDGLLYHYFGEEIDGIIYPSWHDITTRVGNTLFTLGDISKQPKGYVTNGYTNIALTQRGYNKIKEGLILGINISD